MILFLEIISVKARTNIVLYRARFRQRLRSLERNLFQAVQAQVPTILQMALSCAPPST